MNNGALVVALGMNVAAAVNGYRAAVISEAARRGLRLVSGSLSDVAWTAAGVAIVDPIDIRLTFRRGLGRADLDGWALQWSPEHGWSMCCPSTHLPVRYYAGPRAVPMHLVPRVADVLDWAISVLDSPSSRHNALPPDGVDLDDDPAALRRLNDFYRPASPFAHLPGISNAGSPAVRAGTDTPIRRRKRRRRGPLIKARK